MKFKKTTQVVSILALFFLAIMVSTYLPQKLRTTPVEAATTQRTAFSIDNMEAFNKYLNSGTDENDFKISNFGAKFDLTSVDTQNLARHNKLC